MRVPCFPSSFRSSPKLSRFARALRTKVHTTAVNSRAFWALFRSKNRCVLGRCNLLASAQIAARHQHSTIAQAHSAVG